MGDLRKEDRPEAPDIAFRLPSAMLRPYVGEYVGFRGTSPGLSPRREFPVAFVPMIVDFGSGWRRDTGREAVSRGSFVAGLSTQSTLVQAAGAAHCVQVNLTPAGARRLLAMPLTEISDRVVELSDLLGSDAGRLSEAMVSRRTWAERFELLDAYLARRIAASREMEPTIGGALRLLEHLHGRCRIDALAETAGWSRRHFAACFRAESGLAPKTFARILRFNRVLRLAQAGTPGWAGIAAECGYADQAHMIREVTEFAGLSPAELCRRGLRGLGVPEAA